MSADPTLAQLQNGWSNTQGAHLKSDDERTLQAALMLAERVQGSTIADIARRYKVKPDTVRKRLQLAKRERLLQGAAQRVVKDLVPLAQQAYTRALMSEDDAVALQAARDIMQGTGILSKQNRAQIMPDDTPTLRIESLEDYRRARLDQGKGGVEILDVESVEVESGHDQGALDHAVAPGAVPPLDPPAEAEVEEGADAGHQPGLHPPERETHRGAFRRGSDYLR